MNYFEDEEGISGACAESEEIRQINLELNLAHRIVEETNANLFLTGKAGTGKTTFLRHLRESSAKRMVVLAPTGVAAINAGGMTIHSFFQLPFSPFIPGRGFLGEEKQFYRMSREKRRLIASVDLIVIDEVSMVRPDTLDGIDRLLRRMRGIDAPFGGIQLLLIGDLRQLAPVVHGDEWNLLKDYYRSPYFFESHALREAGFLTVELKHIYRQRDPEFIALLNAVRDGNAGSEVLSRLNRLCRPAEPEEDAVTIRLTTHNRIADDSNARHLAMLDSETCVFEAKVTGKFPESSYPADLYLTLKVGARVMFIKNDTGFERRYYNGMLGTVIGIDKNTVCVLPDDDNQNAIEVGYQEWENTSYRVDDVTKEIQTQIDGTFAQIPLRLAWAITIHKSQGLTFDRCVIDAGLSFAPGQLYVALSRCRTLDGMRLETRLPESAVIIDANVNSFIDGSRRNAPDEEVISRLANEYYRKLLAEMFDFRSLNISFLDFSRLVLEYVAPIYPELFDEYRQAEKNFSERIVAVGDKFISLYASAPVDAAAAALNKPFLDKISNGCVYFLQQLAPICRLLDETPLNLDNAAYTRRLQSAADILKFGMNMKKTILKGLAAEEFSPAAYMKHKACAVLDDIDAETKSTQTTRKKKSARKTARKSTLADSSTYVSEPMSDLSDYVSQPTPVLSSPNADSSEAALSPNEAEAERKRKSRERKEKKPKGYSQRVTLRMFRDGKTIEEIASIRNLENSTVGGHLGDMILAGELTLEETLPGDVLAAIRGVIADLPDDQKPTFSHLRDNCPASIPQYYLSLFFRTLRDNTPTPPKQD